MGIFNEFNKKEKPVFTGSRFGFGSGGGAAAPLSVSGGTKQTIGSKIYHTFEVSVQPTYSNTTPASFNFIIEGGPGAPIPVDYLLIGGGGAGGAAPGNQTGGGGGGAGAVIYKTNVALAPGSYPVVVGRGGAHTADSDTDANFDGGDSTFNGLTAAGGGGGGRGAGQGGSGRDGGSAGGGGAGYPDDVPVSGSHSGSPGHPAGTNATSPDSGWGREGGSGGKDGSNLSGGGGGGGASDAGTNGLGGSDGGNGGNGGTYTVVLNGGTTSNIDVGGGGAGGSYLGNCGSASASGGFVPATQPDTRSSPNQIYPAVQIRREGLDGAGGGGCGGGKRDRGGNSAGSTASPGFRGGCGFLQIAYPTAYSS